MCQWLQGPYFAVDPAKKAKLPCVLVRYNFLWYKAWSVPSRRQFIGDQLKIARAGGLEPPAYGFGDRRSTSWAMPVYQEEA